jgi:hypothetical protein
MATGTDELFDAMLSAAQAEFSLALAVNGIDVDEADADAQKLIEAALTAGVVGALTVMRERDDDPRRH